MGRPKVPDSKRQRTAAACNVCRAAKKKCSGTQPCTYCQHRGIAAACSLAQNAKAEHPKYGDRSSTIGNAIRTVNLSTLMNPEPNTIPKHPELPKHKRVRSWMEDANLTSSSSTFSPNRSTQIYHHRASPSRSFAETTGQSFNEEPEHLPKPRMLRNLQGEQVYIGQAASLSYLPLVREIVAEKIGPSQFSHNDRTESMLEAESPTTISSSIVPADSPMDVDQMLHFSQFLSAAMDGLMNIFAASEVEGLLVGSNGAYAPYRNPHKAATINLIVAIGAQCESLDSANGIGQRYFRHAQQLAVSQILEDPSVDMVRAFLLMAFYMLGSCRRNAAFMYIGVATRAAIALGLHNRDSYLDMRLPKFQLRLRIWISLCNLDMICSAILGRPAATTALRSDLEMGFDEMITASEDMQIDLTTLTASYKILSIISNIVDQMNRRKFIAGTIIKTYLDEIEAWKLEYGRVLFSPCPKDPSDSSPDGSIGRVHVSCLYYFAVTLVTRPILIPVLHRQPGSYNSSSSWAEIAQACIDAATYLVQTCVEAQEAGFLLGNMCILKALVFIAGLILGLQSFCKRGVDLDVETSFLGAQKYLQFLSIQSPQAGHYWEILSLLSSAITKQRQSLTSTGRRRYVSKLFKVTKSVAVSGETDSSKAASEHLNNSTRNAADAVSMNEVAEGGMDSEASLGVDFERDLFFDWENLDLTQWDDFLLFNNTAKETLTTPM